MLRSVVVLGATLALASAGCAAPELVDRQVTAADVPIRFAYGAIKGDQAEYAGADEARRGMTVRRASFAGPGEFAIFDLMRTLGDTVMPRQATSVHVRQIVKQGQAIEWGPSGEVLGAQQTSFQGFRLAGEGLACVGLRRSLREHVEATFGDHSQELVTGIYCREQPAGQLGAEEMRAVARALQA